MNSMINKYGVFAAFGLVMGATFSADSPARALEAYPEQPVTLVVARSPGGASDTVARAIHNELGAALGQPVVVENRPGAGGFVAWRQLAAGEPDGYEILLAENALAMATALRPGEIDPQTDFDAVAFVATSPVAVIVYSGLGVETLDEFRELAQSEPGSINFSSAGVASVSHMTLAALLHVMGIEAEHIPYGGGGEANTALAGGHVDVRMTSIDASTRLADEGSAVILAVAAPERLDSLPDVPTLGELGVDPEMDLGFWWAAFVSPGTPQEIKDKIASAFEETLEHPDVVARLNNIGMYPVYRDADYLSDLLGRELQNWQSFVEESGISEE